MPCYALLMKTYLYLRTNIGTPQGSGLSPILFLCLMADMELWTKDSKLSNFADDRQSIIIRNNREDALETTKVESKKIIDFFASNNFVNNATLLTAECIWFKCDLYLRFIPPINLLQIPVFNSLSSRLPRSS